MTKGENTTRIGVRIQDAALDRLSALAKANETTIGSYLRVMLERDAPARYAYLLADGQRTVKGKFSAGELSLMVDICNGTMWTADTIPYGVLANCEDCEPSYYERWKVDRSTLISKLNKLSVTEHFALVAALETFWRAVSNGQQPEPGKILD